MKRYQYTYATGHDLSAANRLLQQGWRPVRELPVSTGGGDAPGVLMVVERDDEAPIYAHDVLPGGVSLMDLEQMPLCAGCTGAEVREVVAACRVATYETGAVLFSEGEVSPALYVILSGRVQIRLPDVDEFPTDATVLLEASPQDVFGESTFFAPAPHRTTATALTPVIALRLDRAAFAEMLQAQRMAAYKLSVNLAALLASRLQATDRWAWELLREERNAGLTESWTRCFGQRLSECPDPTMEFLGGAQRGK